MANESKSTNEKANNSKRMAMCDLLTLNIINKAADMMADNVPDEVREGTQPGTTVEEARARAEKAFCDCVNEIHGVMLKSLDTVSQDEVTKTLRYVLTHDVEEQLAKEGNRLREFYRSKEWAELKELFPELLEEDGASILFTGIYAPIIENLPELKQKIAEHEKQTGQKLTFLGLMDVEAEGALFKKFLQEIFEEQEKKLPLLSAIPNDPLTLFIMKAAIATRTKKKDGELKAQGIKNDPRNRHEKIETFLKKRTREDGTIAQDLLFHRINKQKEEEFYVSLANVDTIFGKKNASFLKLFIFCLQEMNAQNYPDFLEISLQKMVDLGMYSTVGNAHAAMQRFYDKSKSLETRGDYQTYDKTERKKRVIKKERGQFFYNIEYDGANRYVTLGINKASSLAEFFSKYFSILPQFAYSLNSSSFMLTWYIFYLARQNTKTINEKGYFTINLDRVREIMGLMEPDEIQKEHNRKYKQYIYTPIIKAIEEINSKCEETEKEESDKFEIVLKDPKFKASTIKEWLLQGYIEVHLDGAFAKGFKDLAIKTEKDRQRWLERKQEAQARISAQKSK